MRQRETALDMKYLRICQLKNVRQKPLNREKKAIMGNKENSIKYMSVDEIIKELKCLRRKKNVDGIRKYGGASKAKILEVLKSKSGKIAKRIGKNKSGIGN